MQTNGNTDQGIEISLWVFFNVIIVIINTL